ncbi:MAG: hypothetical protein IJW70_06145 [Clostridia bacterium]|nr:hypothetical protein [Clostridia bacterium]
MVYKTQSSKGAASLAAYYLQKGKGTHAYRYFGVHRLLDRPGWCYVFRVAAPGAERVSLVGEFNAWEAAPMQRLENSGVWELIIIADICPEGLRYKYRVEKNGKIHYKSDPYARMSESVGEGASFIYTESHFIWGDSGYLAERAARYGEHEHYAYPMNIYEVDQLFWLGDEDAGYVGVASRNYRSIADLLSQYVTDMGYTHVLIHCPCQQSGGKDGIVTYFAPDASLGTPDDFAYLIDRLHKEHVGVIMELACREPGTHAGGLGNYDGAGMYTKQEKDALFFDYTDPYATTLLYSSALFWLREYHLDGLYIDASEMTADYATGVFVRELVASVRRGMGDALLLLRGTGYRGSSVQQRFGGLGFDFVLDFASEASLLDCFAMPPALRLGRQAWRDPTGNLFAENCIFALSSALSTKQSRSVMGSLDGSHGEKFAAMRLLLLYMTCLPGKKLLFMGNEIGQISPWSARDCVEWFLQDFESHRHLRVFVRALNHFYLQTAALWDCDYSKDGTASVPLENAPDGLVAFKRFDRTGRHVCVLLHFGTERACGVRIFVGGRYPYYACVFATDDCIGELRLQTDARGMLCLDVEGLCGMILAPIEPASGFWIENAQKSENLP